MFRIDLIVFALQNSIRLSTDYTHCYGVGIVDFEQVNADWVNIFDLMPFHIYLKIYYKILQDFQYRVYLLEPSIETLRIIPQTG